jgi:deoxyribose-phosphate aldolase
MPQSLSAITSIIDHALLHPTLSDLELQAGCAVADNHQVASVCVKPCHVARADRLLETSSVAVGTVVGFPHGHSCVEVKISETERALDDGALEIDAVVNVGHVLSSDWSSVESELSALSTAVAARQGVLKVIFATAFLGQEHIVRLCHIASRCRVAFVKTSTGFDYVRQPDGTMQAIGATDEALRVMVREVSGDVRVKASGGLHTLDDILRVQAIGVARVGTSSTEQIVREARARGYSLG